MINRYWSPISNGPLAFHEKCQHYPQGYTATSHLFEDM